MSDDSNVNFSVAEKYSYVYVDEKFSKLAVNATGDAKLVDPLAWSYAETHSYVKVDPHNLGIDVPDDVEEIYAKVIYIPGGTGGGSGGGSSSEAHTHTISQVTNLSSRLDSLSSAISVNSGKISEISGKFGSYATSDDLSGAIASITIPTTLSDLNNDLGFATSAYVNDVISEIHIPSSISELTDNIGFATSAYVNEKIAGITIIVKTSELDNDAGFITSSYVDSAISDIQIPEKISDLIDDSEFATSAYVNEVVAGIEIPSAISYFVNDSGFATSAYVDSVISNISVPSKISDLTNDIGFATSSYVESAISSAQIPKKISDLTNDSEFITSAYVDEAISDIYVPSSISELADDIGLATSAYVDGKVAAIIIPEVDDFITTDDVNDILSGTKVSVFENDADYIATSAVQQMMLSATSSLNRRIASLEAASPSGETNLGDREDEFNMLDGEERADGGFIIDYTERNPSYSEEPIEHEMTVQELADIYNERITRLEARFDDTVVDMNTNTFGSLRMSERTSLDEQNNGVIFQNRV